jgi:hypothetical protein
MAPLFSNCRHVRNKIIHTLAAILILLYGVQCWPQNFVITLLFVVWAFLTFGFVRSYQTITSRFHQVNNLFFFIHAWLIEVIAFNTYAPFSPYLAICYLLMGASYFMIFIQGVWRSY